MNPKIFNFENNYTKENSISQMKTLFISINPDLVSNWGHFLNYENQLSYYCDQNNWSYLCLANKKSVVNTNSLKKVFNHDSGYYSLIRKSAIGHEDDIVLEFIDSINIALNNENIAQKYDKIVLFFYCGSFKFYYYLSKYSFKIKIHSKIVVNAFWDFLILKSEDYFTSNYLIAEKFSENGTLLSMSSLHSDYIRLHSGLYYRHIPNPPPLFSDNNSVKKIKKSIQLKLNIKCKNIFFPSLMSDGKGKEITIKVVKNLSISSVNLDFMIRDRKNVFDTSAYDSRFNFIHGDLSIDQIEDLFLKASIAVLPYENSAFEMRTSGIIVDCLLFNVIPIVFPNTWLSHICKKYNFGVICATEDHQSVMDSIEYVRNYYVYEKSKVSAAAFKYLSDNSWQEMFNIFNSILSQELLVSRNLGLNVPTIYGAANLFYQKKEYTKAHFIYEFLNNEMDFLPYKQSLQNCNKKLYDESIINHHKKKVSIVILGNCQTLAIKKLLKKHLPNMHFLDVPLIHTISKNNYEEIFQSIKDVDIIISQPLSDDFLQLSYSNLSRTNFNQLIFIPNIHFGGFNPESFYFKNINGSTNRDFIIDYHDKFILYGYLKNKSVPTVLKWFYDKTFIHESLFNKIYLEYIKSLQEREKKTSILISDVVRETKEKSMFTMNHPNNIYINIITKRILKKIGYQGTFKEEKEKIFNNIQIPSYNFVCNYLGIEFKEGYIIEQKKYTQKEMIEKYYEFYSSLDSSTLKYNFEKFENDYKEIFNET